MLVDMAVMLTQTQSVLYWHLAVCPILLLVWNVRLASRFLYVLLFKLDAVLEWPKNRCLFDLPWLGLCLQSDMILWKSILWRAILWKKGTEIKQMYADDLVLLSPTKEGLQQHLNLLQRFCQTWALTVNTVKTKRMIFQKQYRNQVTHNFYLDTTKLQHTKNYTYLGLNHYMHRKPQPGCERSEGQSKKSFLWNKKKH